MKSLAASAVQASSARRTEASPERRVPAYPCCRCSTHALAHLPKLGSGGFGSLGRLVAVDEGAYILFGRLAGRAGARLGRGGRRDAQFFLNLTPDALLHLLRGFVGGGFAWHGSVSVLSAACGFAQHGLVEAVLRLPGGVVQG